MSEFKGTKERLIVSSPMGTFYYIDTETTNCGRVATCYSMEPEESKANAVLFSKAPEMLKNEEKNQRMIELCRRILIKMNYDDSALLGVLEKCVIETKQLIKEATQI